LIFIKFKTPFVAHRIQLIAAALLRQRTLTGDEVGAMIAADAYHFPPPS